MVKLLLIFIFTIVVPPILWMLSEYKSKKRGLKLVAGWYAILSSMTGASVICACLMAFDHLTTILKYNTMYGKTTETLIETTISQLEAGETEKVTVCLKELKSEFLPVYKNKGEYRKLVDKTVKKMNSPDCSNKNKHHISYRTKYNFEDEVEFKSKVNGSGKGKIVAVTVDKDGYYDYQILLENQNIIQGGIYDEDIVKLIKKKKPGGN